MDAGQNQSCNLAPTILNKMRHPKWVEPRFYFRALNLQQRDKGLEPQHKWLTYLRNQALLLLARGIDRTEWRERRKARLSL